MKEEEFPDYPELVGWINYKLKLKTHNLFEKALRRYKNKGEKKKKVSMFELDYEPYKSHKSPLDISNFSYGEKSLIPYFDTGGYFVDKNDKICLIYDTHSNPEKSRPTEFMKTYNIPESCLEYMKVDSDKKNPPNFYRIHRPHCFIIRLPRC